MRRLSCLLVALVACGPPAYSPFPTEDRRIGWARSEVESELEDAVNQLSASANSELQLLTTLTVSSAELAGMLAKRLTNQGIEVRQLGFGGDSVVSAGISSAQHASPEGWDIQLTSVTGPISRLMIRDWTARIWSLPARDEWTIRGFGVRPVTRP